MGIPDERKARASEDRRKKTLSLVLWTEGKLEKYVLRVQSQSAPMRDYLSFNRRDENCLEGISRSQPTTHALFINEYELRSKLNQTKKSWNKEYLPFQESSLRKSEDEWDRQTHYINLFSASMQSLPSSSFPKGQILNVLKMKCKPPREKENETFGDHTKLRRNQGIRDPIFLFLMN